MKKILTGAALLALLTLGATPALANGGGGGGSPCDDCTPYSTTIVSDETNTVVGDGNAVAIVAHPAWTASIPGATWIWKAGPTAPDEVVAFEKSFTVTGTTVLSATLDIATDNSYAVFIDGAPVASDAADINFTLATQDTHNLTAFVTTGVHTLRVEVKNVGAYDAGSNPAGLLYKFVVESKTCPDPACCLGDVDIEVKNKDTTVVNIVGTSANTGWNTADGGNAKTKVKKSGNVKGTDNDHNTTSAGGNSSTGGSGGAVVTGNATAKSKTTNTVNSTVIRVRRI